MSAARLMVPTPLDVQYSDVELVVRAHSSASIDGDVDGLPLGEIDGDAEGLALGEIDGLRLGEIDGDADGLPLGDEVGLPLGASVGDSEGEPEGDEVGLVVGLELGLALGARVNAHPFGSVSVHVTLIVGPTRSGSSDASPLNSFGSVTRSSSVSHALDGPGSWSCTWNAPGSAGNLSS